MINRIISECSKIAQKEYTTRYDWVGKVIPWELCKKFKFDHTNKCYMYNLKSALENKTHKILWDFEIQTDYLISARLPDLVIVSKKKERKNQACRIVDFAVAADHKVKLKENEERDEYLDIA